MPLSEFKEPSELLSGIRFELIELEIQNQLTKQFRPSAGFPFHYEEDMPQMWSKTKVRGKPRTKKSEGKEKYSREFLVTISHHCLEGLGMMVHHLEHCMTLALHIFKGKIVNC